jgi:iron complex outermembrane receptor protein
VRGSFNIFLYDAVEYETDTQFEGGLRAGYRSADGRYEAAVFGRNITDEENVIGGIDFNNNTAFVNEPRVIGVSLSARY